MEYETIKDFRVNEPKVTTNEGSIRDQRRKYKELVKTAFDNAIIQGMNPENMMYMNSTNGIDWFKNKITNECYTYKRMFNSRSDVFKSTVLKSLFD